MRRLSVQEGDGVTHEAGLGLCCRGGESGDRVLVFAVASLGQDVYVGVDYALVVSVLPDSETEAVKGMGLFNIANALPQSVAPAIGGGSNYAVRARRGSRRRGGPVRQACQVREGVRGLGECGDGTVRPRTSTGFTEPTGSVRVSSGTGPGR
ncbi:hypothetical protein ACWY4P_36980 [Streptomyces sp. LZ34]